MNFIKRALLSVLARRGKSLLQIIVFTVICVLVISGLAIQTAAIKSADMARQSLGGNVTLQIDTEKMMSKMQKGGGMVRIKKEPIPLKDVKKLTGYDHVKGYNIYSATTGVASNFSPIEVESGGEETTATTNPMIVNKLGTMGDISLQGVLFSDSVQEFLDEDSSLVEGRHLTENDLDANVAIIEKTLAEENGLKVGDKINLTSPQTEEEREFEIVGIYKTTASADDLALPVSALNPYNKIYVPYPTANELKGADFAETADSAVFFMDDPANIASFISFAKKESSIDFETFKLDANDSVYKQMVGPIKNVASFSKNVVYLVTVAGAVILGLIVMMSIRERKFEMGVLLSLGEKRWKLVGQFIVEILIVAVLALAISSVSGNAVAGQVGNQLLEHQIETEEASETPASFMRKGPGMLLGGGAKAQEQEADPIDELEIEITPKDIGMLGMIGLLIAIVSTLLPALSVLRLHPKMILTKQD